MEFLIGMAGALLTVVILCLSAAFGWWLRGRIGAGKPAIPEVAEQERQRLIADQEAFRQQLNYNAEMAYGMSGTQDKIGGDGDWL